MAKVNDLVFVLILLSGLSYLWFAGVHFLEVHVSFMIAALSVYITATVLLLKRTIPISRSVKVILQVSLVLTGWMFARELIAGAPLVDVFRSVGGRVILGVAIAFCLWYVVNTQNQLRRLTNVLIWGITVSAIVGIGQYFVGGPFIQLWEHTGGYLPKLGDLQSGYIAGLAQYSIPFSYQLSAIVPLCFSILISRSKKGAQVLLPIVLLILLAALFLTQSRSATVGGMIGLAVVAAGVARRARVKRLFWSAILGIGVYSAYGLFVDPRFLIITDTSAQGRIPLYLTALRIGMTHPFGTGRAAYMATAAGFYEPIAQLPGAEAILRYTSHNQFLNILGYYGILGLLLLVGFYVLLFRMLAVLKTRTVRDKSLNAIRIGLVGAFTAYVVNSLFHNAGPFVGDPVNWYFIGLALAIGKVTGRCKSSNHET
jgi:hypothetical protein